jgi:hypothetical protein
MDRIMLYNIVILTFLFSWLVGSKSIPASANDFKEIDQLGEEFQRQAPWFRAPEKGSGMTEAITQPQSYLLGEQKEEPENQGMPLPPYFFYDPVPGVYDNWMAVGPIPYRSSKHPHFPGWWKYQHSWPGFYWRPGMGIIE